LTVTPDERDSLLAVARSLDQRERVEVHPARGFKAEGVRERHARRRTAQAREDGRRDEVERLVEDEHATPVSDELRLLFLAPAREHIVVVAAVPRENPVTRLYLAEDFEKLFLVAAAQMHEERKLARRE
jgi:hypothetical protein